MKKTIIISILLLFLFSNIAYARSYVLSDNSKEFVIQDNSKSQDFHISEKKLERNAFLYAVQKQREDQLRQDKKDRKNWVRIIRGRVFNGYKTSLDKPVDHNIFYRYWIGDTLIDVVPIKYDEEFGFSESRARKYYTIVENVVEKIEEEKEEELGD